MRGYPSVTCSSCSLILSSEVNIRGSILCNHLGNSIRLWLGKSLDRGPIDRRSHLMEVKLLLGLSVLPLIVITGCFRPLPLIKAHLEVGSSLLVLHGLWNYIGIIGFRIVVKT